MGNKITEDELWEIIGYIKISQTRYKTLTTLSTDFLMPSEIARSTGIRTTQISNALNDLKKKNLVVCRNETARKGRIYQNTELGLEVLRMLEDKTNNP